jgi:hypothetical protein
MPGIELEDRIKERLRNGGEITSAIFTTENTEKILPFLIVISVPSVISVVKVFSSNF